MSSWLETYMFKSDPAAAAKAADVAKRLNAHNEWLTHGRRVDLKWLSKELGVRIVDLDRRPDLNAAIWGLHLAISITFSSSGAFKIVENSRGDALLGLAQMVNLQMMAPPAPGMPGPPGQPRPGGP